jgi:hypothetical protein
LPDVQVLQTGAAYLWREAGVDGNFPDLWIAKSLFAPEGVVKSAILAAMQLYVDTFGRLPS